MSKNFFFISMLICAAGFLLTSCDKSNRAGSKKAATSTYKPGKLKYSFTDHSLPRSNRNSSIDTGS